MDNRPRFPHDVLLHVASFTDRKSVLALLATNRSLHNDGGKYALQDPVELGGNRNIASFIFFMRPHKHKRWRHLRILRLRGTSIGPRIAEALAKVIPYASHLEFLEFEDAEKTLGAHTDLPLAFAALPAVEYIVIGHGYQHTCKMLEAMHWPLESAELKHSDHEFQRDCLDRIHPASLLKNSRATLKTLECQLWSSFDDVLHSYPVYPHMESLHIEGIWCPSVAHWAICYPNLKRLHVSTVDGHCMNGGSEDWLGRCAAIRSHNLEEHVAQEHQWVELEEFVGNNALDLYLLGLPCRIRAVAFDLCPVSLLFFSALMETARPTDLTLAINSKLFSQPIPAYLEDPYLAHVQHLGLSVMVCVGGISGDMGDIYVDCFLEHVLCALRRGPAQSFWLSLEVDSLDCSLLSYYSSSDEQDEQPMHPLAPPRTLSRVESWVYDADVDALVRRFQDEVPSLEWVKFSVCVLSTSCWKEAESSGERRSSPEGQMKNAPLLVP